jgi:hypothetical protein
VRLNYGIAVAGQIRENTRDGFRRAGQPAVSGVDWGGEPRGEEQSHEEDDEEDASAWDHAP